MQCFYQMRPLLRVTGQQFLVLQVLHGEQDVQNAADTGHGIFCPSSGRKDMDLGTGHMDLIRQRSDKIGRTGFAALHGHIRAGIAEHFQKRL